MDSYQIISNGPMLAMDKAEVEARFARLFKLAPEKAAVLLAKPRTILRSNLDAQTAEMYREKLVAIGVDVELRHVPAVTSAAAVAQASVVDGRYQKPASMAELTVAPVEKPAVERDDDPDMAYVGNRVLPFLFAGSGLEYFRIWIVNLLLTVLTLGIYSAWAKVRTQQYFYGNTQLGGASFQYLATPMQILRGRMIAAVLLIGYAAARYTSAQAGLLALAVLLLLSPALLVLGLSARMRFTAWRHVRFDFEKDFVRAYAVVSLPLLVAGVMLAFAQLGEGGERAVAWSGSLGLLLIAWLVLFPYWLFAFTRFMVNHCRYGNTGFVFAARPAQYYFLYYLKAPLLMLVSVVVAFALVMGIFALTGSDGADIQQLLQQAQTDPKQVVWPADASLYVSAALAFVVLTVGYLLGISYLQAQQFNLRYDSMSLGKSVLSCQLRAWPLLWLWLSNTVGIVLTLGLFIPWAKVRMVEYRLSCLELYASYELNDIVNTARKDNAVAQEVGDIFDVDIAF